MAVIDIYSSIDMVDASVWYGSVVESTASQIIISNAVDEEVYSGSFGYNSAVTIGGEPEVYGTLTHDRDRRWRLRLRGNRLEC